MVAIGRIVSLLHQDVMDVTGTMVWVVFLSTTEVNLGILCVSLPMLGPLLSMLIRRRGASRLENSPHAYNKAAPSSQSGKARSRTSDKKRSNGNNNEEEFGLESIYAPNMEPSHETSVTVEPTTDLGGRSSTSGSETPLDPDPAKTKTKSRTSGGEQSITVYKRWEINHG
jgi:hypothetical protein